MYIFYYALQFTRWYIIALENILYSTIFNKLFVVYVFYDPSCFTYRKLNLRLEYKFSFTPKSLIQVRQIKLFTLTEITFFIKTCTSISQSNQVQHVEQVAEVDIRNQYLTLQSKFAKCTYMLC